MAALVKKPPMQAMTPRLASVLKPWPKTATATAPQIIAPITSGRTPTFCVIRLSTRQPVALPTLAQTSTLPASAGG